MFKGDPLHMGLRNSADRVANMSASHLDVWKYPSSLIHDGAT